MVVLSLATALFFPCWRKLPSGKTARPFRRGRLSSLFLQKYSTLPKFGVVAQAKHPGPRQGADRDRHERRTGQYARN